METTAVQFPSPRSVIAEMLGTFFLALTVGVSLLAAGSTGYEVLYVPMAIGLVIMMLVYTLGSVCGAHFNPAVSLGLLLVRKVTWQRAVVYIIAQIVGAVLGFAMVKYLMGVPPSAPAAIGMPAFIAEALGAFLIVFTVTRVVLGKVPEAASGLLIGGTFVLAITISQFASGGVLNPSLALALGGESLKLSSFWVVYVLGPIFGGLLGALLAVGFEGENTFLKKSAK